MELTGCEDAGGAHDLDRSFGLRIEVCDNAEHGRLAATGRADDGKKFSGSDVEAHPVERVESSAVQR